MRPVQFLGEVLGKPHHSCFRRSISAEERTRGSSAAARQIEDLAITLAAEVRDHGAAGEQCSIEIDLEGVPPVFERHIFRRTDRPLYPGIVHQDLDFSHLCDGKVSQLVDLRFGRNIAAKHANLLAGHG